MRGERGLILAQVLWISLLACLICVAIMRLRLQPAAASAGAMDALRDDLAEQAALNKIASAWTRGGVCSSDFEAGVSCAGVACDCSCDVAGIAVKSAPRGNACALSAQP